MRNGKQSVFFFKVFEKKRCYIYEKFEEELFSFFLVIIIK